MCTKTQNGQPHEHQLISHRGVRIVMTLVATVATLAGIAIVARFMFPVEYHVWRLQSGAEQGPSHFLSIYRMAEEVSSIPIDWSSFPAHTPMARHKVEPRVTRIIGEYACMDFECVDDNGAAMVY